MTRREVLENFIAKDDCCDIHCDECPYYDTKCFCTTSFKDKLARIGAMAILRQNRKKRGFDPDKILTCVTADKAKVGMRGYFADDLTVLRSNFEKNAIQELLHIHSECFSCRFRNARCDYALFYPIDEVEE